MSKVIRLPKPIDYQKEVIDWIDDKSVKFINFVGGRQSGKSYLNKIIVIKYALEHKKSKIGYITPTLKLARRFHKELLSSSTAIIKMSNSTDLTIEFFTGSVLQFFSTEQGDAIRGFQFHLLILDEAAYMSDDVFNLILKPTQLVIGKKLLMCSTPNSSSGFFYNYYTYGKNNLPEFRTKQVNIYDNPFVSTQDIELIKKQVPDRVFRQEYLAEFIEGTGTVFRNFRNCINNNPRKNDVNYYAAIDWAKSFDYTVLTIMNDYKQVVEIYRINEVDYTTQVKYIVAKLNKYKPRVTISEENNVGQVINELLKKEYRGPIRQIVLDNTEKRDMIENLVVGFEQNEIEILDDENLLNELQSFTIIFNPKTKNVQYSAPVGLHDDTVISLAYCYSLVKKRKKGLSIY